MNLKRSATSMALLIVTLSLIAAGSLHVVSAQTQGMSITVTAAEGSDTIKVTGHTVSQITDVTFRITSPGGNVVGIAQVSPDSTGDFEKTFKVGSLWKENGAYTITAMQSVTQNSLYTLDARVEIVDGMTKETSVTKSNLEKGLIMETPEESIAGLSITADAVEGSTTIGISGMTDKATNDVTLTVKSPNGNVVSVNQISPNQLGIFEAEITTGGPLWKQDGTYTVIAQQGNDPRYKDSVEVEIIDGVVIPEFGAIAALILAVAIVSIIAVSAKSRLSIMPRY